LHHAGKSGAQRGISRNDDLLDVQIDLRMVEGWEPGENLMFELTYSKVRHSASFQSQTVALEGGKFVGRSRS
jgi:hypothetical protein